MRSAGRGWNHRGRCWRALLVGWLCALVLGLYGGLAQAQSRIRHIPVSEVSGGQDLPLEVFGDDPDLLAGLELHYRVTGQDDWTSLGFQRTEGKAWRATVPGRDVTPRGLEYVIIATDGDGATERFASKAAPHSVLVGGSRAQLLHARDLFRHQGRRSTAELQVDRRDFGAREGGTVPDRFWRTEAAYTYRPFKLVRAVRVGFSTMRAESVPFGGSPREWGLDAGHAEVELSPHDLVGLRSRLVLGATGDGFTAGGQGVLRIGFEPGARIEVLIAGVADVGMREAVTLHWTTVPRVPMAAGVEVTTWPDGARRAVQGTYQASFSLGEHGDVYGRLGYQARVSELGGLGAGAGLAWSW